MVHEVLPVFAIFGALFLMLPLPIQMLINSCFGIALFFGVLKLVHK